MSESMLREEIEVYSQKYDIHGVIKDYGFVTKLFFTYMGKEIIMGVRNYRLKGETYEDIGRNIIDSYVENLVNPDRVDKLQLHYWYIEDQEINGEIIRTGHGIVTGHDRYTDSMDIHTSMVQNIDIDEDEEELLIITASSVYHCPLAYCRFKKQDKFPAVIPDYESIREKYCNKIDYPSIEPGKVLLVLANFCEYYFHSLYYVPVNSEDGKKLDYYGSPHIGTFQDSYLIYIWDETVDIRYFPHYQNIEFYLEETDGCPLFIENIGDLTIYAITSAGTIRLAPGDRKEVSEANAEDKIPILPKGDLYPADILE